MVYREASWNKQHCGTLKNRDIRDNGNERF